MTYQSKILTKRNACGDIVVGPPMQAFSVGHLFGAHERKCAAGTMLVLEGEDCQHTYIVRSGWLAVAKTTKGGDRQILDFALPGDIIDLPHVMRRNSPIQVEALTFAKVSEIPALTWDRLQAEDPDIADLKNRHMVAVLGRFAHGMLRLGKGRAENRLAFVLMELCVRLRAIGQFRKGTFRVPITQQELGDFAGLSAVHVCRTMQRMQRNGILSTKNHTEITIRDMTALADMAGVEPDDLEKDVVASALGT